MSDRYSGATRIATGRIEFMQRLDTRASLREAKNVTCSGQFSARVEEDGWTEKMRIAKSLSLFLAVAAAALPGSYVAAQERKGLEIGQIIGNESGQVINGWTHLHGGFYGLPVHRRRSEFRAPSGDECCYMMFRKNDEYAIAIGVPIATKDTGGVLAERITAIQFVTLESDEEVVYCSPIWLGATFSVRAPGSGLVRSWLFDGSEFQTLTWRDEDGRCDGPGD